VMWQPSSRVVAAQALRALWEHQPASSISDRDIGKLGNAIQSDKSISGEAVVRQSKDSAARLNAIMALIPVRRAHFPLIESQI